MDVEARAAAPDDLDDLATLAAEAIESLAPIRGGTVWRRHASRAEPVRVSLADDLASSDAHVVAGTIDGTVVGYAVVRAETLLDGGRLATVSDLFTAPGARGVGVGEAMMDAVLAWSADAGCFGVDSLALPGDRETKNFFESFGLVARAIVVHRDLGP